jgi:asparagine synthase (glutamine-hydrolysing)
MLPINSNNNSFVLSVFFSNKRINVQASNPPTFETSNLKIWFRGFIYNHNKESIEEKLIDTYRLHKANTQNHLLGEYSCVIIDYATKLAVCFTDTFGLRPMFYAFKEGVLYVSSHIGLLTSITLREIDDSYIAEYLTLNRSLDESTIYKNCKKLVWGKTIIFDGQLSIKSTYNLDRLSSDEKPKQKEFYKEKFRSLITESILGAQFGKTWAELSGGLDSSCIASLCKDLNFKDFQTISYIYSSSKSADESSWINYLAKEKCIKTNFIDEDILTPLSEFPEYCLDYPFQEILSWSSFTLYKNICKENEVNVIYSGLGGDQVLFGGVPKPIYLADYLREFELLKFIKSLSYWVKNNDSSRSIRYLLEDYICHPMIKYYSKERMDDFLLQSDYCPWLSSDLISNMTLNRYKKNKEQRSKNITLQYLKEDIQVLSSSIEQHMNQLNLGFEFRFPLLYRPLVEFMFQLPIEMWFSPNENRLLMRSSLNKIVPDKILKRNDKKGPDEAYLKGLQKNIKLQQSLMDYSELANRGYVDHERWKEAIKKASFGVIPKFTTFFSSLTLELWFRSFSSEKTKTRETILNNY